MRALLIGLFGRIALSRINLRENQMTKQLSETESKKRQSLTHRHAHCGRAYLRDAAGVEVTYTVQDGQILPFRAARVLATGTTAASIVGWF